MDPLSTIRMVVTKVAVRQIQMQEMTKSLSVKGSRVFDEVFTVAPF